MSEIVFKGTVFSATGEGRKFIDLPWVKRQIEEKLSFTPYAGTLNIRLTKESAQKKRRLNEAEKFEIKPEEGYCTGILIKAKIKNLTCALIIPQIPSYPQDELEVVAAWNLRKRLSLSDGAAVTVEVTV